MSDVNTTANTSTEYRRLSSDHMGISRRRRGGAYIVLLPKKLPIISRAEPVLLLEVVHWDGEVGLGG